MSSIRHRRRTFLLYKETNAKVGRDACENWQGICGPFCNDDTNERGLRRLEFAIFNDLVLANTFGHHKASRRWTWHSPNGQHHNQIDYILVRKRFRSGVDIARTRSFPGADVGRKRAYQLVKDLTTVKQGKAATVQDFFRKMPHRRATDTEPMDKTLL